MITISDWKKTRLEELAIVDSGQGAPQGEEWYKGSNIFVKAVDLNFLSESKYVGDYCKRITDKAITKYKLRKYKKNSVVFPKSGMSIKTNNLALLKNDSYVVNHLAIVQLKIDDENLSKYLYYYLKNHPPSNLCLNSGYPSIRISEINKIEIKIPPSSDLPQIVSILEKAERLRQCREESDKLTNDYLNSVFLKMFGDPNYKGKWFISGIERGMKSIRYGVSSPPKFSEKGIPFIRATNIKNSKIIMDDMKYISADEGRKIKKCELKKNEIIIVRSGVNSGDSAVVTDNFVGNYAGYDLVLELDETVLNPFFLNHLLNFTTVKSRLKQISRRAGQPHLNSDQISKFKIISPPIEKQNSFQAIVNTISKTSHFQKIAESQIEDLFNQIMQNTFGEN